MAEPSEAQAGPHNRRDPSRRLRDPIGEALGSAAKLSGFGILTGLTIIGTSRLT